MTATKSARKEQGVIYLFEWNDKPFYWGIAQKSAFGTRYNVGYRHLIEGTLRHAGKLYIATVTETNDLALPEIENYLIVTYGHEMNSRIRENPEPLQLTHDGDIPATLKEKRPPYRSPPNFARVETCIHTCSEKTIPL